jgi:hypothetical protein
LRILGVHWGVPAVDERRAQGTFREMWRLAWDPGLEVELVAAGAHGTTVLGAATTVMLKAADSPTLADVTAALEKSLLADLADALPPLLQGIDTRAAADADVGHLMAALPALARASRYGDVRGTDTAGLASVAGRMVSRVCAGLGRTVHGLDPDAATAVQELIDGVQDATVLLAEDVRAEWLNTLEGLSDRASVPPLIRGRLTRLMLDTSRLPDHEVALRLGRALSPGTATAEAAGYVEGFLAGGGLLLVHDERLLALVDEWLGAIPDDAFVEVLPLLRRTFGTFAAPERRSIGARARVLADPAALVVADDNDLDAELAATALPVVAQLLGVS